MTDTIAIRRPNSRGDQQIAGPTSQLLGKQIALRPVGDETKIKTRFGWQNRIPVHALEIHEDGSYTNLGLRLVFWSEVRSELKSPSTGAVDQGTWVPGVIQQIPHSTDSNRTVYVMYDLDWPQDTLVQAIRRYLTDKEEGTVPEPEVTPMDAPQEPDVPALVAVPDPDDPDTEEAPF